MDDLTLREQRVVAHLTLLATAKMLSSRDLRMRIPVSRPDKESLDRRALMEDSAVAGLCIAIATIRGCTPAEVADELAAEIA